MNARFTRTLVGTALVLLAAPAIAQSTGSPGSSGTSTGVGPVEGTNQGRGSTLDPQPGAGTERGATSSGPSSGATAPSDAAGSTSGTGSSGGMGSGSSSGGPGIGYGSTYDSRSGSAGTAGTGVRGYSDDAYSLLPFTRRGYVGLNLGKPEFDTDCGTGGFSCDDPSVGGYLYTGGLLNDWLGAEVGYLYTGDADRAGGRTKAQGLNLQVLLRAPIGPLNGFVKAGGMYAQTDVSADPSSGVPTGRRRGWAPTYGAGLGFDITPRHGVVLEWSRAELRFPGVGPRQNLDTTSLGYKFMF